MGWPIGIAVTLAALAASNIWVAVIASDPDALAVEPDYYRKAVAWDSLAHARDATARLGWQVTAELTRDVDQGRAVAHVTLVDADRTPLRAAVVVLHATPISAAAHGITVPLVDGGDGSYAASLPSERAGIWQLDVRVEHGGRSGSYSLRAELAAGRVRHAATAQ